VETLCKLYRGLENGRLCFEDVQGSALTSVQILCSHNVSKRTGRIQVYVRRAWVASILRVNFLCKSISTNKINLLIP